MITWELLAPGMTPEHLGLLPVMLNLDDHDQQRTSSMNDMDTVEVGVLSLVLSFPLIIVCIILATLLSSRWLNVDLETSWSSSMNTLGSQ